MSSVLVEMPPVPEGYFYTGRYAVPEHGQHYLHPFSGEAVKCDTVLGHTPVSRRMILSPAVSDYTAYCFAEGWRWPEAFDPRFEYLCPEPDGEWYAVDARPEYRPSPLHSHVWCVEAGVEYTPVTGCKLFGFALPPNDGVFPIKDMVLKRSDFV